MPCIKHKYRPVNNRYYLTGEPVEEGADWGDDSEWVTEIKCEECGVLFVEPKWKKEILKKGLIGELNDVVIYKKGEPLL
jgi:hypothetical protein